MGIVVLGVPNVHPERRYRANSLSISAIGLKFVGVMHCTMELL